MEDKASPPQDITKETSSTLCTHHLAQSQGNSDEKVGERMELVSDDSITGVDGVLHPNENNVCGSGEEQKMHDEKSVVESSENQAKPTSGISGAKRKAETSERTSEEDTPKAEEECQRKWYCSLCEISTTSEGSLNIHMHGKKHKAKEAKSKSNETPIVTSMDLDPSDNSLQPNVSPTNGTSVTEGGEQTPIAKKWHCSLCQVSATSEALLNAHFLGKKHKAKEAKLGLDKTNSKTEGSENVKHEAITKWYCSVCQVYAASENNLQEHFQGKKHKAKEGDKNPPELGETPENEQEMTEVPSSLDNGGDEKQKQEMGRETGKYWHCEMCNEGTRDEASMNAHRKSKKHKKALRENYGGVIVVSSCSRMSKNCSC